MTSQPYLTTTEVASMLQVSPDFVRSLVHSRQLKCVKLGRVWRFKREQVESFLKGCER